MPAKKKTQSKKTYSVAKQSDGSVQITFTISWKEIDNELNKAAEHLKDSITIKGFRKGKAPVTKIRKSADQEQLVEHALQHILPRLFADAIEADKINPITYPKFELITTDEGKDWQIRASTAENPEFELGNYKKIAKDTLASGAIWTPEKGTDKDKKPKEPTRDEKEQAVIKALMDAIKFDPPAVLVEDETNNRLGDLLARIEKLGLNLDSYLASVNKDAQTLREEYKAQAQQTLRLEILLNAIAEKEKVEATDKEIDEFIGAAQADPQLAKNLQNPTQRRIIGSILRKRKVLDSLISQ